MIKTCETFYANIWIAGDYDAAVQACREFCMETPLCVTVTKTEYVYVAGSQSGVCVRLINYPRFPKSNVEITMTAEILAAVLRMKLYQASYSIEYPTYTKYFETELKTSNDK